MARKDLSRTVIEGGRSYYNSYQRRASHGTGRAREREWIDAIRADADEADARVLVERPHVYKDFHDKLSPAQKWLEAQCGRPWNAVRSDLFATFDTRTTAGRHIVFDHMLWWVQRGHHVMIDRHGVLRRAPGRQRTRDHLGGNRAALTARGWWAAVPLLLTPCRRLAKCLLDHDWTGEPRHYVRVKAIRPLGAREVRWVGQLPGAERRRIVVDARALAVIWP